MLRTNAKPRGYQGDSEMMQMIYDDEYAARDIISEGGILGRLLHKYSISTAEAQAVRNRRALILGELQKVLAARDSVPGPHRLLSVACGPAREVADLLTGADVDSSGFQITLLDQDGTALEEARDNIERAGNARGGERASVAYVKESVIALLRPGKRREKLGTFDFIYSMGLFDYLPDALAGRLMRALYDMLSPGGTLLVGNYAQNIPNKEYMYYLCDWPLEFRTEQQMLGMLDASRSHEVSVGFEPSATQMFLRATKPQ